MFGIGKGPRSDWNARNRSSKRDSRVRLGRWPEAIVPIATGRSSSRRYAEPVASSWRFANPGEVIGDKYAIVQPIGSGGMGIVYEAIHTRLGQRVALKMLLPDLAESIHAVARFEREARAAVHLKSQHVARVFDVDALADGAPYIVMELLEGRDLAAELEQRGPLPIAEAVDYVLEACEAMSEAHRMGIVHRDIKPGNLFLADEGRKPVLKVLDFGISKFADEASPSVTTTRSGLGTAAYMSPEQVRSAKHVDARSDVWSLGVVLYELLTGCQPFAGDTATAMAAAIVADLPHPLCSARPEAPPELERAIMRALEKDKDGRFADAAAFAAAIAPFGSLPTSLGSEPPPVPRTPRTLPSRVAVRPPILSSSAGENDGRLTPRDRTHTRRRGLRDPRKFWVLAGAAGSFLILTSIALVREMGPSPPSAPSAAPEVLASPLIATTSAPANLQERAPEPEAAPSPAKAHLGASAKPSKVAPASVRPSATSAAGTREMSTPTTGSSKAAPHKSPLDLPDNPG